jgi:SAM-dependent methyltransferase
MTWALIIALVFIVAFGGVLLFGAPYLPTLQPQLQVALKLTKLQQGQTLLELGCGDGKVLIAAARQGLNVVGYELNPFLALVAWLRTRRYRKQVKVIWGDFWRYDWPPADAIFVFLLPKYMKKLDGKIERYNHKPIKLVSFAFEIKGKKSQISKDGIFAYDYR